MVVVGERVGKRQLNVGLLGGAAGHMGACSAVLVSACRCSARLQVGYDDVGGVRKQMAQVGVLLAPAADE